MLVTVHHLYTYRKFQLYLGDESRNGQEAVYMIGSIPTRILIFAVFISWKIYFNINTNSNGE